MLPATARLRKDRDVQRVRRFGRQARCSTLTIRVLKSDVAGPRITVVVSKRVDRRANIRNRLKRQLRAQLRGRYRALLPHHDIVLSVQPAAKQSTAAQISADLTYLFQRLRLLSS